METLQEEAPKKPNAIKKFFKIIGIIALVIIGLIVALVAYCWLDGYLVEKEQDKVKMTISYNTEKCTDKNYPLYITIENNSTKTIKKTSFDIEITRKGHSNDLADYGDYKTDVIIKPKHSYNTCWSYKLKTKNKSYDNPNNLEFKIHYQHASFEE